MDIDAVVVAVVMLVVVLAVMWCSRKRLPTAVDVDGGSDGGTSSFASFRDETPRGRVANPYFRLRPSTDSMTEEMLTQIVNANDDRSVSAAQELARRRR